MLPDSKCTLGLQWNQIHHLGCVQCHVYHVLCRCAEVKNIYAIDNAHQLIKHQKSCHLSKFATNQFTNQLANQKSTFEFRIYILRKCVVIFEWPIGGPPPVLLLAWKMELGLRKVIDGWDGDRRGDKAWEKGRERKAEEKGKERGQRGRNRTGRGEFCCQLSSSSYYSKSLLRAWFIYA